MGRRLNPYLGSFGDDGRPKVAFVFDNDEAPADADCVYRLNLKGTPTTRAPDAAVKVSDAAAE